MSNKWKHSISEFLSTADEKSLRDSLRKDWIDFYPEDKAEIFKFLFLGNQSKLFLYFFAIELEHHISDVPWYLFLKVLTTQNLTFPDDFFAELKSNLKKENSIAGKCQNPEELYRELQEKETAVFFMNLEKYKQELQASARIAESERLTEQHMEYMSELRKLAPNEFNVSSLISEQEKKRAERILKNRSKAKERSQGQRPSEFSEEDRRILRSLRKQADRYVDNANVRATDLAFLFRSLGDVESAIDFLDKNPDQQQKDWQLLEYYFSGGQWVALLNHCQVLKTKYEQVPDLLFSIAYAEAVSLWQLNEKTRAVRLMEQVCSMRPNFKSANEMLDQWKEESFD